MNLEHGDLGLDLSVEGRATARVRAARIEVSPEERKQLGALTGLKHNLTDKAGFDLIEQITAHLRECLRNEFDPLRGIKALVEARLAFRLLVRRHYPHEEHLERVSAVLDSIRRTYLREIIRRLLKGQVSVDEADRGIALLNDEAAAGEPVGVWIDEIEDELVANAPRSA